MSFPHLLFFLLFLSLNRIDVNSILNNILHKQLRAQNIGKQLGSNFERAIQDGLYHAGYRSMYVDADVINSVVVKNQKSPAEFDAIVRGNKHSFDNFCDSFLISYANFPPETDAHAAIVEVKLNAKLLIEWVKSDSNGSRYLFLNPNAIQLYTKILVINGGDESGEFIKSLSSEDCKEEYKEVKATIINAKINVFFKQWASGETFSDVINSYENLETKYENLKNENQQLNAKYEYLKTESEYLKTESEHLKTENQQLNAKYNDIKDELLLIKKYLNLD